MNHSGQLSDLQALLRHCFVTTDVSTTTSPSASNHSDGNIHRDADRFKRLIDEIKFSRRSIVTYQLVLLGLLLLLTGGHWWGRFWARRGRWIQRSKGNHLKQHVGQEKISRNTERDILHLSGGSEASNSSSTLHESYAPQLTISVSRPDERTSLLGGRSTYQISFVRAALHKLYAWLVYQPSPVSVVNKTLPSNGTTLVVLALFGLQAFYLFYQVKLSLELLFVFADRASLLFVANLPLLYLLAAKNAPIKILTGYSYESINIFHRRLGEAMCLFALLHSAGMIGVWYSVLRPTGISLIQFLLMKIILLGIGAFVAYELIYFTSLGTFRKQWYELFLGLHVVLQIFALVFVFFHHSGSRPYVGAALDIFIVDRLVYRMIVKSRNIEASLDVMEDGKTTSLCAMLGKAELKWCTRAMYLNVSSGWKVTQHVFLTVPALAGKHILQAHPFTIASPEPQSDNDPMSLRLIIRAQDGFSSDLLQYAKSHNSAIVRLDGPYGSQSAANLIQDCESAVLVAGGSGIAVIWPLLAKLMSDAKLSADAESYSVPQATKPVLFIWVVREASHISWIGEAEIDQARRQGIEVVHPPPTAVAGHPNVSEMISSWMAVRQDSVSEGRKKTGVVCSGPDSMNRAVRNACSRLIGKGQNITVEVEKFGW